MCRILIVVLISYYHMHNDKITVDRFIIYYNMLSVDNNNNITSAEYYFSEFIPLLTCQRFL